MRILAPTSPSSNGPRAVNKVKIKLITLNKPSKQTKNHSQTHQQITINHYQTSILAEQRSPSQLFPQTQVKPKQHQAESEEEEFELPRGKDDTFSSTKSMTLPLTQVSISPPPNRRTYNSRGQVIVINANKYPIPQVL